MPLFPGPRKTPRLAGYCLVSIPTLASHSKDITLVFLGHKLFSASVLRAKLYEPKENNLSYGNVKTEEVNQFFLVTCTFGLSKLVAPLIAD